MCSQGNRGSAAEYGDEKIEIQIEIKESQSS